VLESDAIRSWFGVGSKMGGTMMSEIARWVWGWRESDAFTCFFLRRSHKGCLRQLSLRC